MGQETVIFLHIPKTAGTTFNSVLTREYFNLPTYWIPPNDLNGQTLAAMAEEDRSRLQLVRGHMQYGIHQHLPQSAVYITFVRDPLRRVLSYWTNARMEAALNPRSEHWWLKAAREMTLKELIESGKDVELDNGQVRRLSGLRPPFGECGLAELDEAKENIERHFAFVGTTETFREGLLLLKHTLNWKKLPLYSNSKVSMAHDTQPPGVIERIRELTQMDELLYEFIAERFKKSLATHGPEIQRDLSRFRRLNRLSPAWVPLARIMLRIGKRVGAV